MLIACPSCQRQLNVPENAAGKQVRCPAPDCGTVFYVPAAPAAAQPAAPPAMKPVGAPRPLAPKPLAPKPVAPRPPSQPAGAFDFGGGVAGPAADFGFTESTDGGLKGIGLRTKLGRASGWLNMAAASMVLYVLFVVSLLVAQFIVFRSHDLAWLNLVGAGCLPFVLLPFPIVIVVGARMIARTCRYRMAMTAAFVSLGVGVMSLLMTLGFAAYAAKLAYDAFAHGMAAEGARFMLIGSCGHDMVWVLVTALSLFAGVVALRTLRNAEIKSTFT